MTIWEITAAALTSLSIPHAANRLLVASGAALPDQFAVYQLIDGVPASHADNAEILRAKRMQVTLFSRTGLAALPDVDTLMLAAGFRRGPERELPYNESTRHYGLAKDYFYLEES